jgi:hypothetical protein
VQQQDGEQRAALARTHRNLPTAVGHLERTKQPELHAMLLRANVTQASSP